ncbi:hypothetical protein NE237_017173 [Protea cynaroides]|uniref:Uncharacterized protein n=1 Tax=Protea cynaroides TaxID=273540 RepID=A0A9Q0QMV1_9MAGN|nr:hypothetical protein NE237_017173 [Protea cynaroides]
MFCNYILVTLCPNLTSLSKQQNSPCKLFVTQHDLLRELAIYQSQQQGTRLSMEREDSLPNIWRKQKHQLRNIRLVSIQTAEVLTLDCFATNYSLPPFMKKMKKLKVLIIVNHGHYYTTKVRLEKVVVPSLGEIKKPLKNLQKISLFMCEVPKALSSCNFNFPFMLPNLVEIHIDYCNDLEELPQGIRDLAHVKKLSYYQLS